MEKVTAKVVSVHIGSDENLRKEEHTEIQIEFDGVVGDRHRSFTREAWKGDKQPEGTIRRNERQWSAVSIEELAEIQVTMDLLEPLQASDLGANLCFSGIPNLSKLPKGSIFKFPSGAELVVVEYNPPCHDMGKSLAAKYTTRSGQPLSTTAFSKASQFSRGVVGITDVAGQVKRGDEVTVEIYTPPIWLRANAD